MAKALDGIQVVEFSSNNAAAYAAMLLAEHGADVIRLESPLDPTTRGTPHYHVLNRSKRITALDYAASGNRSHIDQLIQSADITITGFTPAELNARALDCATLARLNPRLIAVNLSPFGTSGPYANLDATDEMVAAFSGITASQWAASGDPVALTFPAVSYSAGILAATAATAALFARADGPGQSVEVSLLAGAFSLQTGGIMRHEKMSSIFQAGPADPLGPVPCYRLFEAADGNFLFIACGNATFFNKFCLALDRPDLVADPRFDGAPWGIPKEHWQTLKDILEPIIRSRPRDEWLQLLRAADVPCAPVMTRQAFIDHPQTRALAMRHEIADSAVGSTVQPGVTVNLTATPGAITGPAPIPSPLLAVTGSSHPITIGPRPSAPRGPLSGVLVLDFCSYIAGSYGPMILAQMGADIIKIESLEGDAFRHFGFGFLGWNAGKRGLALDFTKPDGAAIIRELAAKADIIVENLRPGRMARYGFDYSALSTLNSRLIYMSVTAFGNRGPEHDQPGFDPLLQARSGVMAAQGGHHHHPVYLTCAICDYGAAMLSALGCVLALQARNRTGRGQLCETSLLQSAIAMQAGEFIFYNGRPDLENGFPEHRGSSALSRAYRCGDSLWLYLALAIPAQWQSLTHLINAAPSTSFTEAIGTPSDGPLADTLSRYFATLDRTAALAALNSASIPAVPLHRWADLFTDPQVLANDLLLDLPHSQWNSVTQTGILTQFSATPGHIDRAAPLLGEHTDAILSEYLGYSPDRLASLHRNKVLPSG
ncbi:MAG TPA: CoA transferase [Candidatus Binataceae bacterium]|nr:CoA transferase [Candidatus Binataceae bacterium]